MPVSRTSLGRYRIPSRGSYTGTTRTPCQYSPCYPGRTADTFGASLLDRARRCRGLRTGFPFWVVTVDAVVASDVEKEKDLPDLLA